MGSIPRAVSGTIEVCLSKIALSGNYTERVRVVSVKALAANSMVCKLKTL